MQKSISLVNIKMCDQADLSTVPLHLTLEWLWAPYQKHATPSNVILSFSGILHCPEQHVNLSELDSIQVEKKHHHYQLVFRVLYTKPSTGVGILLYFLAKGQEQIKSAPPGLSNLVSFQTTIILTQPGHYYYQEL